MRSVINLGALSLLCLFGSQPANAQSEACHDQACAVKVASAEFIRPPVGAAAAPPGRCPGLLVDVSAGSADEHRLVCSAADTALQLLGRCSITLRRPLQVQIMSPVRHPLGGPVFGLFDIPREQVLVTKETNIPALVEGTPYARLPRSDFYRSLVVHEVVHGIMHQNLERKATTHAAYEYPAYALQIASLPPGVREQFLRSFDQGAVGSDTLFSDAVLAFDPYFFAARAYHHFMSAPNGCAYLKSLLAGEVSFIAPPM